jgi:hypothetical protein
MYFYSQILTAIIAILSVASEWYATYPYRQNIAPKTKESKYYHWWGFLMIGVVCFSMAYLPLLANTPGYTKTNAFYLFIINGSIYWNLFDVGYSLLITKWRTPFYLGGEANLDEAATKILGNNAGWIKALLLTAIIVLLNILK